MPCGKHEDFSFSKKNLIEDGVVMTPNNGPAHYANRATILSNDCPASADNFKQKVNFNSLERPRVCFLFPGQGIQYANMGKELYEVSPIFRRHFDYLNDILLSEYDVDIKNGIWGSDNVPVDSPVRSQVGIFVIESCIAELWKHWGVNPDVILGHSVGEFAGFVCAGVMTIEEALKLVVERGRLVSKLPPGGMAVIPRSLSETEALLHEFETQTGDALDIAAINTSTQTAVAGSAELIDKFMSFTKEKGISMMRLRSAVAFHSRELDPVLADLENVAKTIPFRKPNLAIISSLTGTKIEKITPEYWVKQTRGAVRYFDASKEVLNEAAIFIDAGPHSVLSTLLFQNAKHFQAPLENLSFLPSLQRNCPEWITLLRSLGKLHTLGIDLKQKRFQKEVFNREKISYSSCPFRRNKDRLANQKTITS